MIIVKIKKSEWIFASKAKKEIIIREKIKRIKAIKIPKCKKWNSDFLLFMIKKEMVKCNSSINEVIGIFSVYMAIAAIFLSSAISVFTVSGNYIEKYLPESEINIITNENVSIIKSMIGKIEESSLDTNSKEYATDKLNRMIITENNNKYIIDISKAYLDTLFINLYEIKNTIKDNSNLFTQYIDFENKIVNSYEKVIEIKRTSEKNNVLSQLDNFDLIKYYMVAFFVLMCILIAHKFLFEDLMRTNYHLLELQYKRIENYIA